MVESSSSLCSLVLPCRYSCHTWCDTNILSVCAQSNKQAIVDRGAGEELGLYDCNLFGTNVGAGLVRQTCQ